MNSIIDIIINSFLYQIDSFRSSFHRQQHYRKSEESESEIAFKCDKETVDLSNGLFANRRASTSLLPSSTEVRLTSNKLPNGYSPSRRSVQSYRAPSQCSFKDQIDNCMDSTLLHFPTKQMVRILSSNS